MYCPRLDHFVRFNENGTMSRCGHMIDAMEFSSWEHIIGSQWIEDIKEQMASGDWPSACQRCKDTETTSNSSIRLDSIKRHAILSRFQKDYVILGGVLDNVCNSACQSCNSNLSTKIGSLTGKNYPKINNAGLLDQIPFDRVLEIDLNGGEPTASPTYQTLLKNLPPNVKIIRVNTNGSRILPNIEKILQHGIHVIVTLSLDGTCQVHDYVRWPITWNQYISVVNCYRSLTKQYTNLQLQAWTTLHILNARDFDNIINFADEYDLNHAWAFLEYPSALNLKYHNTWSQSAKDFLKHHTNISRMIAVEHDNQDQVDFFIKQQDALRGISVRNYI